MYKDINIREALEMDDALLIDVRSEDEFSESTIPGSVNIPLFSNEERKAIGITYKNEGPDAARRLGLKLVSSKLSEKIDEIDRISANNRKKTLAVFCWRGGQRSEFMASILDTMGYNVYRVIGGYKAYRRYINEYLDREGLTQRAVVLYGLTGVGKTDLIVKLRQKDIPVLDLEGLANHRGSVYGKIGLPPSPSQKSFESSIVQFLTGIGEEGVFVVECESRRIGNLILPHPLLDSMKKGYRVLLYTSLWNRVRRIREVYTSGPGQNVEKLQEATSSLVKKLGRNKVDELNKMFSERKFDTVFVYLLKNYYDPLYNYPDGPSEEYDLCVDTSEIEKAAEVVFNFVTNLPEYKRLGRRYIDGNRRKT